LKDGVLVDSYERPSEDKLFVSDWQVLEAIRERQRNLGATSRHIFSCGFARKPASIRFSPAIDAVAALLRATEEVHARSRRADNRFRRKISVLFNRIRCAFFISRLSGSETRFS